MIAVHRSCTIASPIGAVWDALADFAAIVEWAPDVDHACLLTRHDVALGEGIGLTRRIQTGRMTLLERVVTWNPPTTLAYGITGLPPVVRSAQNQWDLVAAGPGRTQVTLTSTVDAGPRPPQQLIARIVGTRLAKASDSMLAGLSAHLGEAAHV